MASGDRDSVSVRWPNRLALSAIAFYQVVSRMFKGSGCCRFAPTCSAYAKDAFRAHGFFRAVGLTVRRVLRCHPFYRGVLHDPVPDVCECKRVSSDGAEEQGS